MYQLCQEEIVQVWPSRVAKNCKETLFFCAKLTKKVTRLEVNSKGSEGKLFCEKTPRKTRLDGRFFEKFFSRKKVDRLGVYSIEWR